MAEYCEECYVLRWRFLARSMLALGKTVQEVEAMLREQFKTVPVAYECKIVRNPSWSVPGGWRNDVRIRNPETDMNYLIAHKEIKP